MKMAVFQWFRCFVGSPHLGPPPGLLLASCWRLAGVLLASSWPLAGFLLASSFPARISLENQFLGRLAKTVNSLHENGCFSVLSVFRGVPPIWGLLLASCWPLAGLLLASWLLAGLLLAGFLLASCWPLAGFLLASCWPLAGFVLASCWPLAGSCWLLAGLLLASSWPLAGLLLATSFPRKISLQNGFFTRLAKLVNSLHENGCFSVLSVFRGVPPIWGSFWLLAGLFLASCWRLAGVLLACCWLLLASCWPLAGLLLASSWPLAGFLLASSFPTRISLGNPFLGKLAKTVNSLHENGCFAWFRGVSWGPPHLGLLPGFLLASCWHLPGLLLASCWPLAGVLLACCWPLAGLLLASCWLLPGLLLASCWLQASPRGFL